MGTLNFTVSKYGRQGRHSGGASVISTEVITSDAYTTSTSASFVEDGSGDIVLAPGQIFQCTPSEPMWIRFGGEVAAVGDGFYLTADTAHEFDCSFGGKVSVIDVS